MAPMVASMDITKPTWMQHIRPYLSESKPSVTEEKSMPFEEGKVEVERRDFLRLLVLAALL